MKKILPYILISLIIVNLFAPFSVGVNNTNKIPELKKSVAEATDIPSIKIEYTHTDTTVSLNFLITRKKTDSHSLVYILTNNPGTTLNETITTTADPNVPNSVAGKYSLLDAVSQSWADTLGPKDLFSTPQGTKILFSGSFSGADLTKNDTTVDNNATGHVLDTIPLTFNGLSSNTNYYLSSWVLNGNTPGTFQNPESYSTNLDYLIQTLPTGTVDSSKVTSSIGSVAGDPYMPWCAHAVFSINVSGCIAQVLYGLIFRPTSFLFGLTGKFFDFTFAYSVNDASYRSGFVLQGWKIIRDFANIFFIFIMLYIAFSTILSLHGFKTKEMIINVVIIGLLINFSLFATQIIIDASNILARVFYNTNSIVIGTQKDSSGNIINKLGDNGEIQLSQALVNKVNPQELISNAGKVGSIAKSGDIGGEQTSLDSKGEPITDGTFILVTLLASAVNIVGLIVFLSVGLVFVSRVIGLWLAMIVVPLTFFTYMVPSMQDIDMIGWKKWWPETLKLAFLAPVFIFFLYLIIQFLNTGLDLIGAQGKTGIDFVVATVVPFAFIMILLTKAKSIASKMSGEMGQGITKGLSTISGVALGAATGGAAFLGRGTIGRLANKADNSKWLNDAASGKKGRAAQFLTKKMGLKKIVSSTAKSSFDARQTAAGNAFTKETGINLNKGTNLLGLDTKKGLGGYAGVQQRKIEKENKFGESLGYDHHQAEKLLDKVDKRKKEIAEAEAEQARAKANADKVKGSKEEKTANANYAAAQQKVTNLKSGNPDLKGDGNKSLTDLEKDVDRNKTSRQMEHALTVKRKSGKIHDIDKSAAVSFKEFHKARNEALADPTNTEKQLIFENAKNYRDDLGNIKKFGHYEKAAMRGFVESIKEAGVGFAKGAGTGLIAGSIIAPGFGTAIGTISGGFAGAIRELVNHSGTTNRQVGSKDDHGHKEDYKDNYNPATPTAPSSHTKPSGGDSHKEEHH